MVGPVGGGHSPAPAERGGEAQDDVAKQALQLLNVLEVYSFFLEQDKEKASSSSDASSLQGQLKHIEQQVEEGKITVAQAAEEIMSLVRNYEKKHESSLPSFDLSHPQDYAQKVADQVFAFQSFVKGVAEREGDVLADGKGIAQALEKLGNDVSSGHLPHEEGLAQLVAQIKSTHGELPPSMRYPLPFTAAY